ncbi:U6 snRNA phosphodiesterase 1-like [Littorina saxatilis]|uniref:U6 snRNA phosphodiesterase n=1 Tax=Littorina saxatilis TaxID=31220 RepID=A0AAN9C0M0_9CAEN
MAALVNYSGSSSDEESDEELTRQSGKRRASDGTTQGPLQKFVKKNDTAENGQCKKSSLPLPGAIRGMFGAPDTDSDSRDKGDNPEQHGGRVRSFPHVAGNWASYVFIPVPPDERLKSFVDQILVCLRPLNFERMDNLHISLSRTVSIRHHWIQPLTESLKEQFQKQYSCICDIGPLKMYTNDEKTRTFISLEVNVDDTNLVEYTSAVDSCFKQFNLPAFYQNPSFHISLVWSVGDVMGQIPDKTKSKLHVLAGEFLSTHTDLSVIPVDKVYLKTGNKMFAFHLCNSHD